MTRWHGEPERPGQVRDPETLRREYEARRQRAGRAEPSWPESTEAVPRRSGPYPPDGPGGFPPPPDRSRAPRGRDGGYPTAPPPPVRTRAPGVYGRPVAPPEEVEPPPRRRGSDTGAQARVRPDASPAVLPRGRTARLELRRQLRQVQRLRLATLALVTLVLLGALPAFIVIRSVTRDPGAKALETLAVPAWAEQAPQDHSIGSRWCLGTCRVRERTSRSARTPDQTQAAYATALRTAGWRAWPVVGCPPRDVPGEYTCWRHDEYTLDLWVRSPKCDGAGCPPAVVTVLLRNRIADDRGR